jgi:tRNA modification GTPase
LIVLKALTDALNGKVFISVLNKTDLEKNVTSVFDCYVSAKTGQGFDSLKETMSKNLGEIIGDDSVYMVRDRHIKLFNLSIKSIEKCIAVLVSGNDMEIAAEELKISRKCLDDLVGVKSSDDVLGDIFSNFCIGK